MGFGIVEIGISTFRVSGRKVEVLYGRQWLEVWKITIIENHRDLAVDVDLKRSTVHVTRRAKPQPEGMGRYVTDNDLVLFDLENGQVLTLELTPTINRMLKVLVENGVPYERGPSVTREVPYKGGAS